MDVIIISRGGVLDNPILIENKITAGAAFDKSAEELLGTDYEEISGIIDYEERYNRTKELLEFSGNEIIWYTGIEVNKHVNGEE